jgi:hypothetical protein
MVHGSIPLSALPESELSLPGPRFNFLLPNQITRDERTD